MVDCSKVTPVEADCPCMCVGGGWCEYHQIEKTAHYAHLCKTNEKYRRAWNECRGPRQGTGNLQPDGPGTELRRALGCDSKGCKWYARFRLMNDWGVGGCRIQFGTIVRWVESIDKMTEEAAHRIATVAIAKAEKKAVNHGD